MADADAAAMRLGMKLDPDFDRDAAYQELYGGADVPGQLRDLGVDAVEIPLGPGSDLAHVGAQARRCQESGLRVSFHPYSEGHPGNPASFDGPTSASAVVHEPFLGLASSVASNQGDTVVNIHPAAITGAATSRSVLVSRSVAFFEWARDWCDRQAPDVRCVAELQVAPAHDDAMVRIGDRPAELGDVIRRAGVDACWDVGHAVWNSRRFGSAEHPSHDLLGRIGHVHCHDVDVTDHLPPQHGDAPWRRFLNRLAATGYARTVVIEVTPPTFLTAGGMPAVEEAIAAVRVAASSSAAAPGAAGDVAGDGQVKDA